MLLIVLLLLGVLVVLTPRAPVAADEDDSEGGGGRGGQGRVKLAKARGRPSSKKPSKLYGDKCSVAKGGLKGVGTRAAAGASAAAAAATPAKKDGRQSLHNSVNFNCEMLDRQPRSTLAVACGTVRVCACLCFRVCPLIQSHSLVLALQVGTARAAGRRARARPA